MKIKLLLFALICHSSFSQLAPTSVYPPNGTSGFFYGNALAIGQEDIVISSQNSQQPNFSPGKVYIFDAAGQLVSTLQSEIANNSNAFGFTVCLQHNFLAVGAITEESKGAVHIYTKVGGAWTFFQEIVAPDGSFLDAFGHQIAINGNTMFVSAFGDEFDGQNIDTNSGSVYIFTFDGQTWNFSQKLQPSGYMQFGRKIISNGDTTIIYSRPTGSNELFVIQMLKLVDGNWETQTPSEPIGNINDIVNDFSLENGQVYLISLRDGDSEKVTLAQYDAGQWNLSTQCFITEFNDQNFTRILVVDDKMFVGSTYYELQTERKFPLLFYQRIGEDWLYQGATYGNGAQGKDDGFGSRMEISGEILLVGAHTEGDVSPIGNAYISTLR